jgi:hypothetical protein
MALVLSGDSPSISGTYQGGVVTSGTAVASTSGTSIDFTGIPSWVKRITVMFNGVSTSGTSLPMVQIGAGSVTSSGYLGTAAAISSTAGVTNFTTGFALNTSGASNVFHGQLVLTLLGSNTWTAMGMVALSNIAFIEPSAGSVALGGTLDRVRITTVNGTDTFDAGSINILYE